MTRFITSKQWTKSKKKLPKNIQVIVKKKAASKITYGNGRVKT